jgi:hypothetical protein
MKTISSTSSRCYLAAAAMMLVACAAGDPRSSSTECVISIGGSVLKVAAEKGFAYRSSVLSACHGDSKALIHLLLFTEGTDGEAMLDHGNVLLALRTRLGVARFDKILRSLGTERQKAIAALLQTAENMHRATRQILRSGDHS